MAINDLAISYPDFQLGQIIDPEKFDTNNGEIEDKINEVIAVVNQEEEDIAALEEDVADNTADIATNAANIATNTSNIASHASTLASHTTSINTNTSNISALDDALATTIGNTSTNTANIATNTSNIATNASSLTTHKTSSDHDSRYYTQAEIDTIMLAGGSVIHSENFIITSLDNADGTFTYTDEDSVSHFGVLDNGNRTFTLQDSTYPIGANALTVYINDTLRRTADGGGITEDDYDVFTLTDSDVEAGDEINAVYYQRIASPLENALHATSHQVGGTDEIEISTGMLDATLTAAVGQIATNTSNISTNTSSISNLSSNKMDKPTNNATATDGQILTSNGDGTSTFETLPSGTEVTSQFTVASGAEVIDDYLVKITNGGVSNCYSTSSYNLSKLTSEAYSPTVGARYNVVIKLTETLAIACYADTDNSDYGKALLLTIDGGDISVGSPTTFYSSGGCSNIAGVALSESKVLLIFKGASNYGYALILSISGSTITVGATLTFNSVTTSSMAIEKISSSSAIIAYYDGTTRAVAHVLSVSDTIVSVNTETVFATTSVGGLSITTIDTDKYIIGYRDITNSSYATACVVTVSGTTVTAGTPLSMGSYAVVNNDTRIIKIDTNKAILIYGYSTSIRVNFLTISGTTITNSSASNLITCTVDLFAIDAFPISTSAYIIVAGNSANSKTFAYYISFSISTSTLQTTLELESSRGLDLSIIPLTSNKTLVLYTRYNGSAYDYGVAQILYYGISASLTGAIGIAKSSATSGNTVSVSYGPEVSGFTGLTQGTLYYAQDNGSLGTTQINSLSPVGVALSSTKMKLLI
jgi:hypothetical protein